MIRIVVGSIAGGLAMFITGFVLWVTPLKALGYSSAPEAQVAAVQLALAQNLPHTGRYTVPDPSTAQGSILYGRGPVATVDYNSRGFSASGATATMIGGLVQEIVVVFLFGLALRPILARVTDFASRARVVVGVSAASAVMIQLSDPIFAHAAWRFAIYALVADILMLAAGGLVLARWFLPTPAADAAEGLSGPLSPPA